MGRPSSFKQATADAICDRMMDGESLRNICRDERMPALKTVMRWLAADERAAFRQQYARARDIQADHLVYDALEIADGSTDEDVQSRKLQVDMRKWIAARMAPKKYGDAMKIEATGADGSPLIPPSFVVEFVKPEDAE